MSKSNAQHEGLQPQTQRVLERLGELGCDPVPVGDGWQANCPAHRDEKPSLSIGEGDAKVVLTCHAGCKFEAIIGKLEIRRQDLYWNSSGEIAIYCYQDENGNPLFQVVRKPDKKFLSRYPKGGKWVWAKPPRLVPYNLPKVKQAISEGQTIFICEGEKDADRLARVGLVATTNPFGAGKWEDAYSKHLAGAGEVVITPDNDAAGWKHAQVVAASVRPYVESVKVLRLPGLPEKGDVSDWMDNGRTVDELLTLAGQAKEWVPRRRSVAASDVREQLGQVEWDWHKWIPRGMVSLILAPTGIGKTYLGIRVLGCYTDGWDWPDGTPSTGTGGSVLWCDTEAQQVVVLQRAERMGIDLDNLRFPSFLEDETGAYDVNLESEDDWTALTIEASEPDIKAVFIDSLRGGHGGDENDSRVGLFLRRAAVLARTVGKPVIVIHHTRKLNEDQMANLRLEYARGSGAIAQFVRSCIGINSYVEGVEQRRTIVQLKPSLALPGDPIGMRIEDNRVTFGKPSYPPERKTKKDEAADCILTVLDGGQWYATNEVMQSVLSLGISEATFDLARQRLTKSGVIESRKEGDHWVMRRCK